MIIIADETAMLYFLPSENFQVFKTHKKKLEPVENPAPCLVAVKRVAASDWLWVYEFTMG